ncbi:hypothetical protein Lal_00019172 [Lupinus albus]|nr:hypothetical protein Lal_00019172 [Lupinus albus]
MSDRRVSADSEMLDVILDIYECNVHLVRDGLLPMPSCFVSSLKNELKSLDLTNSKAHLVKSGIGRSNNIIIIQKLIIMVLAK